VFFLADDSADFILPTIDQTDKLNQEAFNLLLLIFFSNADICAQTLLHIHL
jgi:hypothetical protein